MSHGSWTLHSGCPGRGQTRAEGPAPFSGTHAGFSVLLVGDEVSSVGKGILPCLGEWGQEQE